MSSFSDRDVYSQTGSWLLGTVRRHLNETEPGPKGLLAHELGVHRHERRSAKPRASLGQVLGTGNEMHRVRI